MADNQSPSIISWVLAVIFLLTSIAGWFFYYQKDSELSRSQAQLKRTQERYDNKVDELYVAWDDLQKSKNEQFNLSDNVQSCNTDKEKLAKNLENNIAGSNKLQADFNNCIKKQQANDEKLLAVDQVVAQIKSQMAEKEQSYVKQIAELEKLKTLQDEFEQGQSALQQTLAEQITNLEQLNAQITKKNKELEEKALKITQLSTSNSNLEQQHLEISQKYQNLESQYNELAAQQIQLKLVKQQLDACQIKTGKNQRKLEELADLRKLREQLIPAVGQCKNDLQASKQELVQLTKQMDSVNQQLDGCKIKIAQSHRNLEELADLRKLREQLIPAVGQCKTDLQNSNQKIAQQSQQIEELKGQLTQEKSKQQSDQKKAQNSSEELNRCRDELKQVAKENTECKQTLSDNTTDKEKLKTLQDDIDNKNKENTILSLQINKLQEQLQKQQQDRSQCQTEQQNSTQQLSKLSEDKKQLIKDIQGLKEQSQKCQESLILEQKNTSGLSTDAKKLNQQVIALEKDKKQLSVDLNALHGANVQLQNDLLQLQNSKEKTSQQLLLAKEDKTKLSAQLIAIEEEKQRQLEKEQEQLDKLKELLKAEIEANFVTIKKVEKDRSIRIKITNNLIFNLGDTHISRKGVKVLNQVADVLKKFPERNIKIIGHTDNIPVKKGADSFIVSNWELSAARAAAAIRYLQHATKINPARMHLVGASQYQPIANINTKQGRAANRRIEICLLSPES